MLNTLKTVPQTEKPTFPNWFNMAFLLEHKQNAIIEQGS